MHLAKNDCVLRMLVCLVERRRRKPPGCRHFGSGDGSRLVILAAQQRVRVVDELDAVVSARQVVGGERQRRVERLVGH